ncbi:cytochrome P450, partial [Streptomyces spectabilis]
MMDLAHPVTSLDPYATDIQGEGRRLRELGRLVPVELIGSVRAWATAHHTVGETIFTHPDFRKDPANWAAYQNGEIPPDWPVLRLILIDSMLNRDDPHHGRLRSLVSKAFTPRRIESLRPRIQEVTNELLHRFTVTAPGQVIDLRAEYAFPLPMQVICEMFGLDHDRRVRLAADYSALHDSRTTSARLQEANCGVEDGIRELIDKKRQNPTDDLTSDLISTHDQHDGRLSSRELSETMVLILFAGHETTQNLITNAARELIEHPYQLAVVRAASGPGWPKAVEETLRRTGPVNTVMFRYASTDILIPGTGVTVRRGEPVVVCVGATGRDPERFGETAEVFDPSRSNAGQHLSFARGAHYCIGAPLGRMMATTA